MEKEIVIILFKGVVVLLGIWYLYRLHRRDYRIFANELCALLNKNSNQPTAIVENYTKSKKLYSTEEVEDYDRGHIGEKILSVRIYLKPGKTFWFRMYKFQKIYGIWKIKRIPWL